MTALDLIIGFVVGCALGTLFALALKMTVERMMVSKHPYVLLLVSFAVRLAAIASVMLLIANIHWTALVACMVGFVAARMVVVRALARAHPAADGNEKDEHHG